ncbi:hypothetical protein ILUMI_24942 [Ignelater luminosus]|uniref:Uncharacterized protein n=1 Tax=Ignelater luminosus TaxID=2038154 RepID=A0A8K0CCK5_IGNLU|nr:hypothetical protein ILUMI_24942 [Ignelater luminosus]
MKRHEKELFAESVVQCYLNTTHGDKSTTAKHFMEQGDSKSVLYKIIRRFNDRGNIDYLSLSGRPISNKRRNTSRGTKIVATALDNEREDEEAYEESESSYHPTSDSEAENNFNFIENRVMKQLRESPLRSNNTNNNVAGVSQSEFLSGENMNDFIEEKTNAKVREDATGKDQCEFCFSYKQGNAPLDDYSLHIAQKDKARDEKNRNNQKRNQGTFVHSPWMYKQYNLYHF